MVAGTKVKPNPPAVPKRRRWRGARSLSTRDKWVVAALLGIPLLLDLAAVLGALYLDAGLPAVRGAVARLAGWDSRAS